MALRPIYKQHHLQSSEKKPDSEDTPEEEKKYSKIIYVVFGVLILLGVATGFFLSRNRKSVSTTSGGTQSQTKTTPGAKAVGSSDTKTFKDFAEGTMEIGGLDGEGTHNLVRDGGPSQTVYLISSVVDLDQFAGKQVKVWGQTMAAKKAPWLMDVGKVEVQ